MAQISSTSDAQGIFGIDLSSSFNAEEYEAPVVVMMLTSEIERQAKNQTKLDLYKLYRTKIPLECLIELRDVLNTSDKQLQQIDLTKYEIQYLVSILKRYLRELPDPVIPVKYYEQFIQIFKQNAEKQTVSHLMHLINYELPEHHRVTFKWIMAHLCRVCCLQFDRGIHDQPLPLVQVFCHIFLRPVWQDIIQIVYNTPEHIRIMELLLLNGDWQVKLPDFISAPALPPRKSSRIAPMAIVSPQPHVAPYNPYRPLPVKQQEGLYNVTMNSPTLTNITNIAPSKPVPVQSLVKQASQKPIVVATQSTMQVASTASSSLVNGCKKESLNLNDAEWYWGNITRDEVKEKLMDARDGTFVVRDAINGCGEYTLTLKKDGTDRVIKIFHNNGRYGFLKDCTFASVVELINFHRTYSLKDYNSVLDIKLSYPVSRFVYDDEYHSLMENKEALVQKFVDVTTEIKTLTHSLEMFHESYKRTDIDIGFKRQAHEAFQEAEAMFQEQIDIQNRYRVEAQPHERNRLDENSELLLLRLKALTDCAKNLDTDLDTQRRQNQKLELDINKLKLEINALLRQEKRLKQLMMLQNISDHQIKQIMDEGSGACLNQDSDESYDETSWYFPKFSRSDAEKLLSGAPVGTFLIRLSAANRAYALSIVANGTVNHCIIYHTEHGTFGFAEPYNIYKSLKELVLHYSINSLEEHNEALQTTLKTPYYIYAQLSSSSNMSSSTSQSSSSSSNQRGVVVSLETCSELACPASDSSSSFQLHS